MELTMNNITYKKAYDILFELERVNIESMIFNKNTNIAQATEYLNAYICEKPESEYANLGAKLIRNIHSTKESFVNHARTWVIQYANDKQIPWGEETTKFVNDGMKRMMLLWDKFM